ncbi:unnamed protein product [Prorocentrum cordatum]|uniref:Uncharacterized protein n=1 Tax=Prorocentrum cordatum TaxID=2364126 RepID=A0ABN9RYJ3_9DINO|nr:unnamed protein product [Polarella glacialis]
MQEQQRQHGQPAADRGAPQQQPMPARHPTQCRSREAARAAHGELRCASCALCLGRGAGRWRRSTQVAQPAPCRARSQARTDLTATEATPPRLRDACGERASAPRKLPGTRCPTDAGLRAATNSDSPP